MKPTKKLFAATILFASILFNPSLSFSQCNNTVGGLFTPNRVEVQAPTNNFVCITTGNSVCSPSPVAGTLTLPGMGINQNNPAYMLDILCAVGYRIGGNYVLWHDGDVSSIFVGVNAGNTSGLGLQNTFVGGNAGSSITTNGNANVAVGYYSLTAITGGNHNTALGDHALYSNTTQNFNTAVGGNALQNSAGDNNTAVGYNALILNTFTS